MRKETNSNGKNNSPFFLSFFLSLFLSFFLSFFPSFFFFLSVIVDPASSSASSSSEIRQDRCHGCFSEGSDVGDHRSAVEIARGSTVAPRGARLGHHGMVVTVETGRHHDRGMCVGTELVDQALLKEKES